MAANKQRIKLLQRVTRLREVEKRTATAKLAEAQGMHGKLLALQTRSGEISASYSARKDAGTGSDLSRQLQFTAGVEAIRGATANETRKAEHTTRAAASHLRVAERRHEITSQVLSEQKNVVRSKIEMLETSELARKLKGSS